MPMTADIRTTVFADDGGETAFLELVDQWDTLASQGITDTPFQKLAYQKAWWTHLGQGTLKIIAVYTDDTLIGIAPLMVAPNGVIQFNASKEETDYLDIIVSAEHAEAVWSAVIDCLCTDADEAPIFDFWNIPAESPSRQILSDLAAQRGFSFAENRAEVCPIIPLPDSFDAYLAGIDKKQRHEIKRKMRKAAGAEVELVEITETDDLELAINEFLTLLQSSTPDKHAWLTPERTAVFHEVAKSALADGTLQLLFNVVDGQKVSALFNFIYKGRTWVYNSGLNPEIQRHLSLGWVTAAQSIEKAIALGHTSFDFLRGDEKYKYRFGAKDTEIFRIQISGK